MYNFTLQILLVGSLATIITLFARALPRIVRAEESAEMKFDAIDRLTEKIPLERIDSVIHVVLEKWLRKVRVVVLRFDNTINSYLDQLKKYSQERQEKEDLKEKMKLMKEDKNEEEKPETTHHQK